MPSITSRFALFNNWNFNNVPGLQVYRLDPPGMAQRTLNIFPIARTNRRKLSSGFYDKNIFNVSIYITRPTRELLDQAIDTLMANIQADEGALVVPMSGGVRQYTATFAGPPKINAGPDGGFIDLTLQFECSESFGYDTNYTLIRQATGLTAASLSTAYTQGGSAREQGPYVEVQYTAAPTGATNGSVTIGNGTQSVVITRAAWAQYDLIQVDFRAKTVKVNGSDVDFTGALWENGLGLQVITYADTFSTRTYRTLQYVYNRYV